MQITKTRSQVIHEAADKLSLAGTGQPLEAEYFAKLDGNLDPILMQLNVDNIAYVGDPEAIPSELFDCIAGLLANTCAPLGGLKFDPQIKIYYESMLKRITASEPAYSTLEGTYY